MAVLAFASLTLYSCKVESLPVPEWGVRMVEPPPDITADPACKLFSWPLSPAQAASILKQTDVFADTFIYMVGPPPQMAAFNVLLDQPDAVSWFDDIGLNGGNPGRLYALCAFQLLDQERAAALAEIIGANPEMVYTQFGCVGEEQRISELLEGMQRMPCGKQFRESRDDTYKFFDQPDHICIPTSPDE